MTAVCMIRVAARQHLCGQHTHVEPLGWTPKVPVGLGGDRRQYTHERGTIFGKEGWPEAKLTALHTLIPQFKEAYLPLATLGWLTGDGRFVVAGPVEPRKKRRKRKAGRP